MKLNLKKRVTLDMIAINKGIIGYTISLRAPRIMSKLRAFGRFSPIIQLTLNFDS